MRPFYVIKNIILGNISITDTLKFNLLITCASVIHLCIGFIFLYIGIISLSIYNFLVLILYAFVYYLVKKKQFVLSYILAYFDVFLHSFISTLLVGLDYGFLLYLVMLVPISLLIAYSTENFPRRTFYPVILSALDMIVFICCSYYSDLLPTIYPNPGEKVVLLIYSFNSLMVFSTIIVFSLLFTFEIRNAQIVLERRNQRLDIIASLDPLTGLLNRRSMEAHMNVSMQKAKEQGRIFSLVLCDLDDFKRINDTYGHDCGDQVLLKVSEIIRSHMREFDYVCRWGGEEILILLDCEKSIAKMIAERIRYGIATAFISFDDEDISFTMTFGISSYAHNKQLDQMIQEADEKMYVGKRNGKNKVIT